MERLTFQRPGYDCRTKCVHEVKGDHGIHCDEWWYVVKDGDVAVSLNIFSGIWPKTAPHVPSALDPDRWPMAADLTVHVAFPVDEYSQEERECQWVEGGKCYGCHSSTLWAADFYKKHGVDKYEQPESFWLALEKLCKEQAEEYRASKLPTTPGQRIVEI